MNQKFSKSNRLCICRECGKKTHSSIDGNIDINLCKSCLEKAYMENDHSDGHHEKFNSRCYGCRLDKSIKDACDRALRNNDRVSVYSDGMEIIVRLSVAVAPRLPEGFRWIGEAMPDGKFLFTRKRT